MEARKQSLHTPLFTSTGSNFNKTLTQFPKAASSYDEDEKEENKQQLIDEALVFKCAMTRDYAKLTDLQIISEGVTFIDAGNVMLKQFTNLKTLDLSFNKLQKINNLDTLKELRELNLSYNRIETMENLNKLPNLRVLVLDHNKIKQLENLKYLRKLEILQVTGNLLEDLYIYGGVTEPMIELKEIQAGRNKIKNLKQLQHFPNVEEINLSGNPITNIPQEAFQNCIKLQNLYLDEIELKYPQQDLMFLASTPGLYRLSINKVFKDMQTIEGFVDLPELEFLSLQGNGIISILGIEEKFPNLTVLDLSQNRIFSVENVDILSELPNLAEVFFNDNPICVHKHLKELVKNAVPFIEVINREEIVEAGYKFKEEIFKLKQEMTQSRVGTLAGDRIIEEAENDPNIILSNIMRDDLDNDPNNQQNAGTYGAGKLNEIIQKMQKGQAKTDQAINDFEKNFGLRLQRLNDDEQNDTDDPQIDAEHFEKFISSQFDGLKKNFRGIVDNIRTKDYRSFVKINEVKAKANESNGAYNKLDQELQKLKQQMDKANQAKELFNDFFSDVKQQKPQTGSQYSQKNQSPKKISQQEEYYDEEYDNELGDDDDIESLYQVSMKLNSKQQNKRVKQEQDRESKAGQEDDEASEIQNQQQVHQPRIGSKTTAKWRNNNVSGQNSMQPGQFQNNAKENNKANLPKSLGGSNIDPMRSSASSLQKVLNRGNSQQREAREFIIKGNSSNTNPINNTSTTSIGFGPQFSHQQKKILGMSKPHQLSQQNDIIKQLLNKERAENSVMTNTFSQRSGSSFGINPSMTTKPKDSDTFSQTSAQFPLKKRQTPGSVKKVQPLQKEPRSQYSELFNFNMSDSFQKSKQDSGKKQTVSQHANSSQAVNKTLTVSLKDKELYNSIQDELTGDPNDPREKLISDKKLEKQERESYKNSFLVKLFDGFDFKGSQTQRNSSPQKSIMPKNLYKDDLLPKKQSNADIKAVEMAINNNNNEQKPRTKIKIPLPRNAPAKKQ
eukprot:403334317